MKGRITMSKRCDQCELIPIVQIHNPAEYTLCVESFLRTVIKGDLEIVYASCPLEEVIDEQGRFYSRKLFHQFRCTKCGTIYGMYVDATQGGEIKINDKIFDPDDYEDKVES